MSRDDQLERIVSISLFISMCLCILFWLQISMDDSLAMNILDGGQDLGSIESCAVFVKGSQLHSLQQEKLRVRQ